MTLPLSTATVAGLVASVTSQRRTAARLRAVLASPTATESDLRAALAEAATRLETHALLTETVAAVCGARSRG